MNTVRTCMDNAPSQWMQTLGSRQKLHRNGCQRRCEARSCPKRRDSRSRSRGRVCVSEERTHVTCSLSLKHVSLVNPHMKELLGALYLLQRTEHHISSTKTTNPHRRFSHYLSTGGKKMDRTTNTRKNHWRAKRTLSILSLW